MDMQPRDPGLPVTTEALMRYLDGELPPDERGRMEEALSDSTELQRELAMYRALKDDIQGLHLRGPDPRRSVWDDVNAKLNRPMGWVFLVVGLVVWTGYGAWVFATSARSPWEKLGTGGVAIGILILLASVIWERIRELETDPYRNVQR